MARQYPLKFTKREKTHLAAACIEFAIQHEIEEPKDVLRLAQYMIRSQRQVLYLIHSDGERFLFRVGLYGTVREELYNALQRRRLLLKTA